MEEGERGGTGRARGCWRGPSKSGNSLSLAGSTFSAGRGRKAVVVQSGSGSKNPWWVDESG